MSTVGRLSTGPACEPAKLIIEVVGLNHPEGQKLMLSEHGSVQPAGINGAFSKEILEDQIYSSTLHTWPCENTLSCDVWLEIETISGSPIRLPLAENITASPRQADGQWNQVAPVVPMTMLRSGVRSDDEGIPVLARTGYLYVFSNGMPWRELEIRQTEEGTFYHDINLNQWRENGRPDGKREASGVALQEIWLPARWNNQPVADLQLAYSEIQWSAPRIRRIETEANARAGRCQRMSMAVSQRHFESMARGASGRDLAGGLLASILTNNAAAMQATIEADRRRRSVVGRAFPLSLTESQRPRQEDMEYLFNEPGAYLLDLEGLYPHRCLEHADQTLRAYLTQQSLPRGEVETDAIAFCMERHLLPTTDSNEREARNQQLASANGSWQTAPAVVDVLQDARERRITGVVVEDGVYRMRQLRDRMTALQNQTLLASEIAGTQTHFASALLVENYILSDRLGSQPNPLKRYSTILDGQGINKIRRALAARLRLKVKEHHDQARTALAACLDNPHHLEVLADTFSQEGAEYGSSFSLAAQMLLAASSPLRDPLILMPSKRPTSADRFIARFQNDDHPLRTMLLPERSLQACMEPYQVPDGEEQNEGDGRFRPKALAKMETSGLPDPQRLMLLEARVLVSSVESGLTDTMLTAGLSRSVNFSLAIAANVQSALTQAQTRLHELGLQVQEAEALASNVETTRGAMRSQGAYALRMNVFQLDSVAFARAIAPTTLGPLRAHRTGNVNQRDLMIMSFELMGETNETRQVTGSIYDTNDRMVASTNREVSQAAGLSNARQEHLLWAAPRTAQITTLYANLHSQVTQATAAQERVLAAAGEAESLNRTSQARRHVLRGMNSPLLPPILVGVEAYNLFTIAAIHSEMARTRGGGRADAGIIVSSYDLALAIHLLTERIARDTALVKRTAQALDNRIFINPLASRMSAFSAQITARILLGAAGAIAVTGLALWDAMDAFNHGDSAGWGHLLVATGGTAVLVSAFMAGPASGAVGLAAIIGPAGWVLAIGAGLMLAGIAVTSWLRDAPMAQWLKLGPFGPEEIDGFLWMKGEKPAHLQNEHEAFYRLVALLAGIRIDISTNPHHAGALRTQPFPGDESNYYAMRRANKRIRITSNIPALISSSVTTQMRVGISMTETTQSISQGGSVVQTYPLRNKQYEIDTRLTRTGAIQRPTSFVVLQEKSSNGLDIYVEEPELPSTTRLHQVLGSTATIAYGWAVRVQLISEGTGDQNWVFPAPEPKDPLQYEPSRHDRIEFTRTGLDFWADEEKNPAERAT
ncbi:MAG: toxin VasX [Pseudoalteromonas distincta]